MFGLACLAGFPDLMDFHAAGGQLLLSACGIFCQCWSTPRADGAFPVAGGQGAHEGIGARGCSRGIKKLPLPPCGAGCRPHGAWQREGAVWAGRRNGGRTCGGCGKPVVSGPGRRTRPLLTARYGLRGRPLPRRHRVIPLRGLTLSRLQAGPGAIPPGIGCW